MVTFSDNIRYSILIGKLNSLKTGVLEGVVHNNAASILRGVIVTTSVGVLEGKPQSNSLSILLGVSYNTKKSVIGGVVTSNSYGALYGVLMSNRLGILFGVTKSLTEAAIIGRPTSSIKSILKGLFFNEKKSILEGHLFTRYIRLFYSLKEETRSNLVLADIYPFINSVQTDLDDYEEGIRDLLISFGSGKISYKYDPITEELTSFQSDINYYGDWIIEVFGENINDRNFRESIIDYLSERDFDRELKKALRDITDNKYHEFTISFGIKGASDKVYCIMRVKSTAERKAVIMGRPFPIYLLATDFGFWFLRTGKRFHHRSISRNAIIKGRFPSWSVYNAIMRGNPWDIVDGIIKGKPYNERPGISKGKPFDDIGGITPAVIFDVIKGISKGKPYDERLGITLGKTFKDINAIVQAFILDERNSITEGRDTWTVYLTNSSLYGSVDKLYNEPDDFVPHWFVGTEKGLWVLGVEEFFTARKNISSVLRGIIWSEVKAVTSGKPYNNISAAVYAFLQNDTNAILKGKPFYNKNAVIKSVIFNLAKATTIGKTYNEVFGSLYGKFFDEMFGFLHGKFFNERLSLLAGLPQDDKNSILNGRLFNNSECVVLGKSFNNIFGLLLASDFVNIFDNRDVIIEGIHTLGPVFIISESDHVSIPRNIRAISSDASGRIWAAYEFGSVSGTKISYSDDNGQNWTLHTTVSGDGENIYPSIAVDFHRDLHLVWQFRDTTTGTYNIGYNLLDYDTDTWGGLEYVSVSGSDYDNVYPALATDGSNGPHVIWSSASGGNYNINYREKNISWTPIEVLTSGGDYYNPCITINNQGVHAAWYGNDLIEYRFKDTLWSGTEMISSGTVSGPSIVIDSSGDVHLTWEEEV